MNTFTRTNVAPSVADRIAFTPHAAYRRAWWIWLSLPVVPSLLTALSVWRLATAPERESAARIAWITTAALICLAVVVPAAFFWRGHLFRAYTAGGTVPPKTYLLGMTTVWLALATAGLLASLGSLITRASMPNLAVGGVALLVYWTLWPTGGAMIRRAGGSDDPEVYEEPR